MSLAASKMGRPSLVRTLTTWLALSTLLAMIFQVIVVAVRTYLNETDLLSSYVQQEARFVAHTFRSRNDVLEFKTQHKRPNHYFGPNAASYAFRILAPDGSVLAECNSALLNRIALSPEQDSLRKDLWFRRLQPPKRMYVAGGLKLMHGGRELYIEVATLGDPDSTYLNLFLMEILDDVWMPMIPLVLLSFGVMVIIVRRSMRPLLEAAQHAGSISSIDRGDRFDTSKLPYEANSFASAINRLLDRVSDLVAAQRHFLRRAAHELRTPLSIIILELGNIEHPRARRLENDVKSMSEMVDRLFVLAQLEGQKTVQAKQLSLTELVQDLIDGMSIWAQQHEHRIECDIGQNVSIVGDEAALREAVRNLLENAVKHTPRGTSIRIAVKPDLSIIVEDSGPGLDKSRAINLFQAFENGTSPTSGSGLGLAIVRQAVDMHHGTIDVDRSHMGGARFTLKLPQQSSA